MAHGYLLASFLSPIAIVDDAHGGSLANRLRFLLGCSSRARRVAACPSR